MYLVEWVASCYATRAHTAVKRVGAMLVGGRVLLASVASAWGGALRSNQMWRCVTSASNNTWRRVVRCSDHLQGSTLKSRADRQVLAQNHITNASPGAQRKCKWDMQITIGTTSHWTFHWKYRMSSARACQKAA